jgi:rubredoxin
MRIPVELDRSSALPLAAQLADQLREAIRHGRIPAGARLPSSRALADQLGLTVPELEPSSPGVGTFALPAAGEGSFICRGCYYIYSEAKVTSENGRPSPFASVGDEWSCPDCGTGKANFRPYLADLA